MTKRFRMVAGPNGSGKTTLARRLAKNYAVNFYTMLNADDVFAQVTRTRSFFAPFPVEAESLAAYAERTEYAEAEKARFRTGEIKVDSDCVRFLCDDAVNSYTVALLVSFLQDECLNRGISFSQETVFSHPSKVSALAKAKAFGFRTYLYYVATDDAGINADRVAERYALGGHDVPEGKIMARYLRSLSNLPAAMPHLSRAFFFDNSGAEMRHLASFAEESGFEFFVCDAERPRWFCDFLSQVNQQK